MRDKDKFLIGKKWNEVGDEYIEEEKNFVEDDVENHPDFDFDTQHTFGDIESDSDIEL